MTEEQYRLLWYLEETPGVRMSGRVENHVTVWRTTDGMLEVSNEVFVGLLNQRPRVLHNSGDGSYTFRLSGGSCHAKEVYDDEVEAASCSGGDGDRGDLRGVEVP